MSEREDDFLGRWSRRKAQARGGLQKKEADAPPVHKPGRMRTDPPVRPEPLPRGEGPPAPKTAAPVAEADDANEQGAEVRQASLREEATDKRPAARADDAPEPGAGESEEGGGEAENFEDFDFDALDYDSDYTRFMKGGVPEAVRKRALRMLWGSNPILANIDGLNDYDDDFTDAALAVKGLLKTSYKADSGYLTDEERDASYSEEARKAGAEPADGESGELAAEEMDAEDIADDKAASGTAETASAQVDDPGDAEPDRNDGEKKTPRKNDKA
jgi:hypothetical protein